MKTIISAILLAFLTPFVFSQTKKLSYAFSVDTNAQVVHVTLKIKGSKSGTTTLELPDEWASEEKLYHAVKNLKVSGKKANLEAVSDSVKRSVSHKPGADLTVSYDLKQDWDGPVVYPNNFRAVIQPDFFQFTGYALFVKPELQDNEEIALQLDWSKLPDDWNIGNSFHSGTRKYKGTVKAKDLANSVFVAGDFRMLERKVGGQPVHIALRGSEWTFKDEELLDRVSNIISMERQFWNDHTEPYYFVSLIPFEGRGSANGTSLHQAFMLAMTSDQPLEDWLLAHEYFHRWNGTLMTLHAEIEQEHSWFTEGFTEYYTYKLLLANGIISRADYLRKINGIIAAYYLSPVRNTDRRTVGENFWSEGYKDLPYKQGFVYAMYTDNFIRRSSGGKHSLDDVMHELYRLSKTRDSISEQDFTVIATKFAGKDLAPLQEQYIDNGGTIPVEPYVFGSEAPVEIRQIGQFDPGFDVDSTIASGSITGVIEGGPAWNAGLRDGQTPKSYSIYWGNVGEPLEIGIEENGAERTISYIPMSNDRQDIPQFVTEETEDR
jgi:predicted metalloprotease with PDZ domain